MLPFLTVASYRQIRNVDADLIPIVDRLAARASPALQRALLEAIGDARAELRKLLASTVVSAAIEDDRVWEALARGLAAVYAIDGPLFRELLKAAAQTAGLLGFTWGDVAPEFLRRAERWASDAGAQLVTNVSRETRDTLRASIRIEGNLTRATRAIMQIPALGLDRIQMRAFQKEIADLVATAEEKGWTAARFQREVDRRYRKRLRYRAKRIAITEAREAGNRSQIEAIRLAKNGGLLPAHVWVEWVARVLGACPICEALDGALRDPSAPGALFVSRPISRGSWKGRRIGYSHPTAHPFCYCGLRTVIRRAKGAALPYRRPGSGPTRAAGLRTQGPPRAALPAPPLATPL